MAGKAGAVLKYDPRVRRGALLLRATVSPAGLLTGGALAGIGLVSGIGLPFVIGAGVAAWLTSVFLHLRDPKLVSAVLEPQFDRDLTVLDGEHLQYMTAALHARDRFEDAATEVGGGEEFGGMRVRVTDALHRLYDSVVWSQRAAAFLAAVDAQGLVRRLRSLPENSPVAVEIGEQLEEVENIGARRNETLSRVAATVTGIETLAVKMGAAALGAQSADAATQDIRELRSQLDAYVDGLEEVERDLRSALQKETS